MKPYTACRFLLSERNDSTCQAHPPQEIGFAMQILSSNDLSRALMRFPIKLELHGRANEYLVAIVMFIWGGARFCIDINARTPRAWEGLGIGWGRGFLGRMLPRKKLNQNLGTWTRSHKKQLTRKARENWSRVAPALRRVSLILHSAAAGFNFMKMRWRSGRSATPNQFSHTITLSLPRVIRVKFPLQPHQKYNITQYEELGFS